MKIYTLIKLGWDGSKCYIIDSESFDYTGPISECCGATSAQQSLGQQQSAFFTTLTQQAQSVFGSSSSVFQDLTSAFAPILAAGPNQQGFSDQELSNLNSQAITETGQAYNNAKTAVGEQQAAEGGGNTPGMPAGATTGQNLSLAESAANQTSGELSQITQANYAQGRQNWLTAAQGLGGATGVFNPATGAGGAATGAGSAAGTTQENIANESNSWINALIGAGGAIAGAGAGAAAGGFNSGGSGPSTSDAEANGIYEAGQQSGSEYF